MQILVDYSYLDATIKSSNGTIDAADPTAQLSTAHPIGPLTNCAVAGACAAAGQAPDVYTGYGSRGQNLSGNQLPNSPKNKVAVNVLYTFYLPNDMGRLTPSLTYIYRDKQYGSIFNRVGVRSRRPGTRSMRA